VAHSLEHETLPTRRTASRGVALAAANDAQGVEGAVGLKMTLPAALEALSRRRRPCPRWVLFSLTLWLLLVTLPGSLLGLVLVLSPLSLRRAVSLTSSAGLGGSCLPTLISQRNPGARDWKG
jgi:hypothetical protein